MQQANFSPDEMPTGHALKTRAEQERISSFLRENTRRSSSQERSRRYPSGSSRQRHHRHPLDPVESDSDSEHRSRHRSSNKSKSKHRRSYSRSSSSGSERRRKHKQQETTQRRHRRHSSGSSSHSSTTRSKSRERKRANSAEKQEPRLTSTIIMYNIPTAFNEHELLSELSIAKVPVQEIRIIHRRDPATHLQTAYVEFNTVQEAEQWMSLTQGTFLLNGHSVTLTHRYDDDSTGENAASNSHRDYQRNNTNELRLRDWDCYKCGVQNFKRRDHCFNCHISREDSERTRDLDGFTFVGLNPCNTLVLRGLDILTTKETIESNLIELTFVYMKNTAIVKDNYTGVSRGFAFVEYNSIHESVLVYEKLQSLTPGVEIDGKAVIVHFSKNNFATSLAQIQNEDEDFYARRAAASSSSSSRHRHRQEHEHERSSNVAQLLPTNNVDRTNTAAEIAQQALQNIHAQKQRDLSRQQRRRNHSDSDSSSDSSSNQQSKRQRSSRTSTKESEQYTTPDPSKFEWFPDVGYHFDKTTGFYFDAKSSYFYNPTTQKYMYWDPAQSTYVPVEDTATTAAAPSETASAAASEADDKAEKAKNAQKVAKEMELWAKKEREKKEKEAKRKAQVAATTTPAVTNTSESTAAASSSSNGTTTFADVGLPSVRPAGGLISLSLASSNSSSTSTNNRPALLAAFDNPDSDNDDTDATAKPPTTSSAGASASEATEEKLIDWQKLTCLLCQRQFDTREILEKHINMSNLHKENLAKAGIARTQSSSYRDRAKERRAATYGSDESGRERRPTYGNDEPVRERRPAHGHDESVRERRPTYGNDEPVRERRSAHGHDEPVRERRHPHGADDSAKRHEYSPVHERSHSSSSRRMPPQSFAPSSSSSSSLSDSIGSKLMKKHGWQEGQGLGKKLQGRANPIEAEMRQSGAGLGAEQPMRYRPEPGESYKDVVRRVARARFSMMES